VNLSLHHRSSASVATPSLRGDDEQRKGPRRATTDYAAALRFARRAADKGDGGGESNLGALYVQGWGVPQDVREGIKWWAKTVMQGNEGATKNMRMFTVEPGGVPVAAAALLRLRLALLNCVQLLVLGREGGKEKRRAAVGVHPRRIPRTQRSASSTPICDCPRRRGGGRARSASLGRAARLEQCHDCGVVLVAGVV
jgi:TPR repeat protein